MKRALGFIMLLALAAGPAAAQGTFSPGQRPGSTFGTPAPSASKPGSYLPPPSAAPAAKPQATYGAPQTPSSPGFKPHKPFSGGSVYSPPPGAKGSDPCKTSVYVNACGKTQ